jgi:hypothetical protein
MTDDEHGDPCPVFGIIPDLSNESEMAMSDDASETYLLGLKFIWIEAIQHRSTVNGPPLVIGC